MYTAKETGTERSLCIENVLEDIPGGGIVDPDDFKSTTLEMKEGALLGVSSGVYHLFKTAKIVAGGSASAPRIDLKHELKVGNVISDGVVALEIATITTGSTYDTLAFSSGTLSISATNTVLYVVETADTTGSGHSATATVQGKAGDYLTVAAPKTNTPEKYNGIKVVLAQNSTDNLAVAYASGVLTITLANSTTTKNTVALILAAIVALATTEGVDFSTITLSEVGWDAGGQDGATITTATDNIKGGVNYTRKTPLYSPVAIALNSVDLTPGRNKGCGLLKRGSVNESLLPYYVDSNIKAFLPLVNFV